MVKWLFFDLGSTLIDETQCDEHRLQALLRQSGAPGREVLEQTMAEFASQNRSAYRETAQLFGLETEKWPRELEKLYPCVPEVLQQLSKQYRLGIIANQNFGTESRLEEFGIRQFFEVIAASAELGIAKPDPRIFQWALEKAACRPDEAVMIGDRLDNDIAPASRIGMQTIWIRQGQGKYGNRNLLRDPPTAIISELTQLLTLQKGKAL